MKLKEMIYDNNINYDILAEGVYKGYIYRVINRGSHPCCYVRLNVNDIDLDDICCHGGITYNDDHFPDEDDNDEFWIGWDYAHLFDYIETGLQISRSGKKWTTDELELDCFDVIEQICDIFMKG